MQQLQTLPKKEERSIKESAQVLVLATSRRHSTKKTRHYPSVPLH